VVFPEDKVQRGRMQQSIMENTIQLFLAYNKKLIRMRWS
jgi:hypothetical protein